MAAQNAVGKVTRDTQDSSAKLAAGERIIRAADDAAGLAISEKFKAEIRSSRQANRNANDGISLVQVAEGGLSETASLLVRMRELSMQAATDTLMDSDRDKASLEYEHIKQELERISRSTEYNGKKLLNGSGNELNFQVGVGADSEDDHITFNASKFNSGVDSLGVSSATITSKYGAQQSLGMVDGALSKLGSQRALLGSIQNRLNTSSNNLGVYTENMAQANSRIRDLDYAEETSRMARNQIVGQASTAMLAQANSSPKTVLKLIE